MSTEATIGTEPVDTDTVEAPVSLAEFREQFPAAPKEGQPAPEPASEKTPRRAKSHRAEPDDVPQIAALTKQLREAEDAIKIERKDGESDRVFQLRKRAEIAKRAATPAPAPVVERPAPAAQPRTVAQPSAFKEKEPTIEDFKDAPDPWLALSRAMAGYDRRKDAFDAAQETHQQEYRAQAETFAREINQGVEAHGQRMATYLSGAPADVRALYAAEAAKPAHEQVQLPLALRGAIEFHDRGGEMITALLKDPNLADELFLLTNGHAVGDPRIDPLVATVRRRLLQRISGAPSGSPIPSRPVKLAPRPPNPERTVPQTPRDTSPSDAPSSLAAHRATLPAHLRH